MDKDGESDAGQGGHDAGRARAQPPRWSVLAGAHGVTGMTPAPLFGAHVGLERGSQNPGWWAPAWRVSGGYSWRGGYAVEGAVANFRYWHLAAEFCPVRTPQHAATLRACLTAEAGVLDAWGSGTPLAHSVQRFGADFGGALQAQWTIASSFRLELGVAILAPLRRDRFLMGPTTFHEVPPVCGRGTAALVVAFP